MYGASSDPSEAAAGKGERWLSDSELCLITGP